jgi:hypothetical protein
MVPARNVIYACMQDFVVNDRLLVSILSGFTQWTHCMLHKMLDVFRLGVVVEQSPAPCQTPPTLMMIFCDL